ncbi:MAG TPA: linear amide C-N hydrolase [Chitinophagaceae bacterium]|nr:linear amide C-N hydrolase [Chitinophagaceae bacterium]
MKRITGFVFFLFSVLVANGCTTFFINHNGQMVFGRNYDWMADAGMICTNQKGLAKTSMKNNDGTTISWISQFGSITFNQYGKEFPTGGMNEKGLVVELMWLDGTMYPSPDERPAIGVLQWIQYQLDNCGTIDEVISTDKKIRIISKGTPLHYLVADANGNAATIEFLHGKMTVHKSNNLPFPVLTNDTYESSVAAKQNGYYNRSNSLERFVQACNMVQQYSTIASGKSLIDHSFDILNKVAQGDHTKWSIVYDISNKKIYFKTQQFQQLKSIEFSSLDFSCTVKPKAMDMNKELSGDIKNSFADFSIDLNRQITGQAFDQSKEQIQPTSEEKEAVINYAVKIFCK